MRKSLEQSSCLSHIERIAYTPGNQYSNISYTILFNIYFNHIYKILQFYSFKGTFVNYFLIKSSFNIKMFHLCSHISRRNLANASWPTSLSRKIPEKINISKENVYMKNSKNIPETILCSFFVYDIKHETKWKNLYKVGLNPRCPDHK